MLSHVPMIPREAVQLFFVSVLVAFSVLVGQALYEYANKIDRRVEKKITDRKHPDITYVLYDILWAPFTLLVVLILIRIGIEVVASGTVTQSLITVLNGLLVINVLWFAVRTIKEVIQIADTSAINTRAEA